MGGASVVLSRLQPRQQREALLLQKCGKEREWRTVEHAEARTPPLSFGVSASAPRAQQARGAGSLSLPVPQSVSEVAALSAAAPFVSGRSARTRRKRARSRDSLQLCLKYEPDLTT